MNAHDRLRRARNLSFEGQYEEALAEFEWFHQNSLAEDPSLRGVRRSFALSYWVELGEMYPPARSALLALRDRGHSALIADSREVSVFGDVAAINHYLGDESATYRLFRSLHAIDPTFAARCFDFAVEAIVSAEDYALARSHIPNPAAALSALLKDFNESAARAFQLPEKRRCAMRLRAYTTNFAADVHLLLAIVRNTDGALDADLLAKASINQVSNDLVRKRVARRIAA